MKEYNGTDSAHMNHKYHGLSKYCAIRPEAHSFSGLRLFRSFHRYLLCRFALRYRQKDPLRSSDGANPASAERANFRSAFRSALVPCQSVDRRAARNSLQLFNGVENAE